MPVSVDGRMKRWQEQRWILDAVISTVGVEWDQGRLGYMSAPGGVEAVPEFRATGARIKRVADFVREFSAAARRREAKAVNFETEGRRVAARESYMIAALLWATARWPIFEVNESLQQLEERINHCYVLTFYLPPYAAFRAASPQYPLPFMNGFNRNGDKFIIDLGGHAIAKLLVEWARSK